MNVFKRELRAYSRSTLIWTVSLSTMIYMYMMIFSSFSNDVIESQKLLTNLPEAVRAALDISLKNFFTVYGFYAYLLTFVGLAAAVQSMNLGVGIISKEVSGKTADFLLTKPISRFKVITSKAVAALCNVLFMNMILLTVSIASANIAVSGDIDIKLFSMIGATLLFVQVFFLSLGLLMGVTISKVKSVVLVSLPTVFMFFIIGTLGALLGEDKVRYLSPFKLVDTNYVIENLSYEWNYLMVELVFVLVAIIISYVVYLRKDVRAAV